MRSWSVGYVPACLTLGIHDEPKLYQFYLDDLGDEPTVTAFRMLVKDLLILFQAGNEGVINVLGALSSYGLDAI